MSSPFRLFLEKSQIGLLARANYRQGARDRMVQEATREWGRKPSVAELESSILGQLQTYAAENKASLIVSWSQAGESYHWLQAWAAKHSIAFADWVPKADAVRAAIPKLSLENLYSGAHHRGWTNQTIAREFARQIRARAS